MEMLESQLTAKCLPICPLPAKYLAISQLTFKKYINNSQLSVKRQIIFLAKSVNPSNKNVSFKC